MQIQTLKGNKNKTLIYVFMRHSIGFSEQHSIVALHHICWTVKNVIWILVINRAKILCDDTEIRKIMGTFPG